MSRRGTLWELEERGQRDSRILFKLGLRAVEASLETKLLLLRRFIGSFSVRLGRRETLTLLGWCANEEAVATEAGLSG